MVLKVIGLQISLQYLKKEDRKGAYFLHAAEHQSFNKLGLFLMDVARFYRGRAMFIVTCFLAMPDRRNFLTEHCNTIITAIMWRGVVFAFAPEVDVFQEKQGILQQIILCPSSIPEKASIRP